MDQTKVLWAFLLKLDAPQLVYLFDHNKLDDKVAMAIIVALSQHDNENLIAELLPPNIKRLTPQEVSKYIIKKEVDFNDSVKTIFRRNALASKLTAAYMRLHGGKILFPFPSPIHPSLFADLVNVWPIYSQRITCPTRLARWSTRFGTPLQISKSILSASIRMARLLISNPTWRFCSTSLANSCN